MAEYNWGQSRKDATTVLDGEFPVVIVKAEVDKTSTGKARIKVQVKITSGPYVGRSINDQLIISPESPVAMKIFYQHMDTLGLGDAFFSGLTGLDMDAAVSKIAVTLQGKEAVAILKPDTYQGVTREKIKGWKGAGGVAGLPTAVAAALPLATALPVAAPVALPVSTPPPLDEF